MLRRVLVVLLSVVLVLSLALTGCKSNDKVGFELGKPLSKENIKIGVVYISKINDQGWSNMHYNGIQQMVKDLGLNEDVNVIRKEDVLDNDDSSKEVIINLINEGCNVIIGTSYGYGPVMKELAAQYKNVAFLHCSGAFTDTNLSNYFGRMYQARFLSGIAAGMKTKSNKIGYVAAQPIAEVIRGINAFTLGVRAVNPNAVVYVKWTNSWFEPTTEKANAETLIAAGCDVIAQHQDSPSAQVAAEQKGVYGVGYNKDMTEAAPKAELCAPAWDWSKYYTPHIKAIIDGTWKSSSWWEGLESGVISLAISSNGNVTADIKAKIDEYTAKIKDKSFDVFGGREIKDNQGNVKVTADKHMTDAELLSFNWFVEGVDPAVTAK